MLEDGFYKQLIDNLYDGVYFVDRDRRITYWNRGAERLTGYNGAEVLGHCCWDNLLRHVTADGEELCHGRCPLIATIDDGDAREAEVYLHHKAGYRLPVQVRCAPIRNSAGAIVGAVEVFSDNTAKSETVRTNRLLGQLAMQDPLTGIGNRRYIEHQLHARLDELRRAGTPFALVMLDLDGFKGINDTWGHAVGDDVLRMVASTLSHTLRPHDAIARWGGDEFVVALAQIDECHLAAVAERLRFLIAQSFLAVEEQTVRVSASVGGTVARAEDTVESLMRRGDHFLYQSKHGGRDRTSIDQPAPPDPARLS
jgi:diguanylate cyclase (GGDEF)-like protein/PAS domain S-box-containing protein